MPRGRFISKSFYNNYRLNSMPVEVHHPKIRKHIVEHKAEDKTPAEIKTDDLKVAGMIKYYQDQLGRMLTPHDYNNLVDYADNYLDGWFEKAVDEAIKNNARTPMRYIEKIMENWREEGVNPLVGPRAKTNREQSTSTEKLKESTTKKLR